MRGGPEGTAEVATATEHHGGTKYKTLLPALKEFKLSWEYRTLTWKR